MKSIGKFLSFFGVGVLYLLVCIPHPLRPLDVLKCKCGITGLHIGSEKRAKQVSDALPGLWIPVWLCVIPFVKPVEQTLHWLIHPLNEPYKTGSGRTEIFWMPAHFIVFGFLTGFWVVEIMFLEWAFGVDLLGPIVAVVRNLFHQ